MTDIDKLKTEARQLLEEVNPQIPAGSTSYIVEPACESSFKNRLQFLKQKVASLQLELPGILIPG